MGVELHLPDLPEVPISLGQSPALASGPPLGWHQRLRDALAMYLPLLVMALLALASWWLLKHTPRPVTPPATRPASSGPDYTMQQFALERFDAAGRLRLRLEGARLRHFPDTDRIDVDAARLRAISPDGRVTTALARRALANGDGSELQLIGGAEVHSVDNTGQTLTLRGEFLDFFLVTERVESDQPVSVWFAGDEIHAAGVVYDNAARRIDLKGPMRAVLPPRSAP